MDKPADMKKMASMLKQSKNNEIKEVIGEAYNTLVVNRPIARISEMVFKEYFLDYFRGIDRDVNSPILLKWLELAGGPYNEVIVIDDNTGESLYTVPAVYVKPITDTKGLKNVSFNNVLSEFNLRANRIYADGINYLNRELSSVNIEATNKTETVNAWSGIFKKYATKDKTAINSKKSLKKDVDLVNGLDYD